MEPALVTQEQLNQAVESATIAATREVMARIAPKTIVRSMVVSIVTAVIVSSAISIAVTLFIGNELGTNNAARIAEQQTSRKNSAIISCEEQNVRHEKLYVQIEAEAATQAVTEPVKYRASIRKARELELLLNVVQPQENCEQRAKRLVEETLRSKPPTHKRLREPGPLRLPKPG